MTPTAPSVTPTTYLYEITQAFLETPVGLLPVVEHGRSSGSCPRSRCCGCS